MNITNARRNVSVDTLFSRYTQEQIMEAYTGVPLTNEAFTSPFRVDNDPSCSYYYRNNSLVLHDFGGYFYGDCIATAAKAYGITDTGTLSPQAYAQTINKIYYDLKVKDVIPQAAKVDERKKRVEVRTSQVKKVEWRTESWSSVDYRYWKQYGHIFYCDIESRRVVCDSLEEYEISPISHLWINGSERFYMRYTNDNPTYLYKIRTKGGKYCYKFYKPLTKERKYKWRGTSNHDKNNPVIQGYKQLLDDAANIEKVFWISSLKDAMCLNLVNSKWRGYAYNSESYIPDRLISGTDVYFADNDWPGMRQAVKIKQKFPNLKIIWIPKNSEGIKDLADYVAKYGVDKTRELINNLLKR